MSARDDTFMSPTNDLLCNEYSIHLSFGFIWLYLNVDLYRKMRKQYGNQPNLRSAIKISSVDHQTRDIYSC